MTLVMTMNTWVPSFFDELKKIAEKSSHPSVIERALNKWDSWQDDPKAQTVLGSIYGGTLGGLWGSTSTGWKPVAKGVVIGAPIGAAFFGLGTIANNKVRKAVEGFKKAREARRMREQNG